MRERGKISPAFCNTVCLLYSISIMRLHRFIGTFDCSGDRIEIVDADVVNQIVRVLRLVVGDRLIIGNGAGMECVCEIAERHADRLAVLVIERHANANEPVVAGILYCAILKRENFELVVQKATEIGIREIIPVITERTVKLDIKEGRLQKIIMEAAEQSGRGRLPVLHAPMRFADALVDAKRNAINLFFDLGDADRTSVGSHEAQTRGLFVGPEGGWTETEVAAARAAGCLAVSLGALTLRAETAAIIACYVGTRT